MKNNEVLKEYTDKNGITVLLSQNRTSGGIMVSRKFGNTIKCIFSSSSCEKIYDE